MNTARTVAQRIGITLHQSRAIVQIGCDLAAAGRLEEARVIFSGMVTLNPKDSAAAGALGSVLQKLGRIDEAKDEFTRALAIDPKNIVALCGRGELRMRSGDKGGADDLKRAVQVDPNAQTQPGKRAHAMVAASKKPQPKVVPAR